MRRRRPRTRSATFSRATRSELLRIRRTARCRLTPGRFAFGGAGRSGSLSCPREALARCGVSHRDDRVRHSLGAEAARPRRGGRRRGGARRDAARARGALRRRPAEAPLGAASLVRRALELGRAPRLRGGRRAGCLRERDRRADGRLDRAPDLRALRRDRARGPRAGAGAARALAGRAVRGDGLPPPGRALGRRAHGRDRASRVAAPRAGRVERVVRGARAASA